MKRALVSVSDKTGLVEFVQGLVDMKSFLLEEQKKPLRQLEFIQLESVM